MLPPVSLRPIGRREVSNAENLTPEHSYKYIDAGKTETIASIKLISGEVAFIYQIGNSITNPSKPTTNYYTDSYITLNIDGNTWRIQREVAPINYPRTLTKPFIAKHFIEWIGTNGSGDNGVAFEVLNGGVIYV
jgi:hypothetical protein